MVDNLSLMWVSNERMDELMKEMESYKLRVFTALGLVSNSYIGKEKISITKLEEAMKTLALLLENKMEKEIHK